MIDRRSREAPVISLLLDTMFVSGIASTTPAMVAATNFTADKTLIMISTCVFACTGWPCWPRHLTQAPTSTLCASTHVIGLEFHLFWCVTTKTGATSTRRLEYSGTIVLQLQDPRRIIQSSPIVAQR
ncbi:hypothetical protein B9Z19DRAFT_157047 [Tuber borchii]|uniref:Uncharacterized protein n=1 Tax=Tuber borchii TaxID=42251 RepID=A0A2T6ZQ04_TUBBO|nr:hypothetical protein B9Z19DRAFT_157047 [Tuber borchii]